MAGGGEAEPTGTGAAGRSGASEATAAPDDRPRAGLGTYALAATAARAGDEMAGPALLLLALAALGSASRAATLLSCLTIAAGVGGPVLGALLDRAARPGRVLAAALLCFGALVALAGAAVAGSAPLAVACAIAAAAGLAAPSLSAGWSTQLPAIVPAERLERGFAADVASYNVAALAGPAAVGALALAGAGWAVAAAVVLVALAAPLAWRLPPRPHRAPARDAPIGGSPAAPSVVVAPPAPAGAPHPPIRRELAAGVRAIARTAGLARATAASTVSFAGFGMLVVACPLIGAETLGGEGRGTALLSVVAAGSLLATALVARRQGGDHERRFALATVALGAALLALGLAPSAPLAIAAAALVGVADGPQLTALFVLRQRTAPARLRGQVFTMAASLKLSAAALGALAAGALAPRSIAACLAIAAALQLLAAAGFAAAAARERRRPRAAPAR